MKAPHFHLKLRSSFKADSDRVVREVQTIIDDHLPKIEEVIGN